ncbi:MAG: homocysteine S-methyltransferase family protein [Pseudomonadota bacterium]
MGVTILDGGLGQELVARSCAEPTPLWSTRVMLDEPALAREVHDAYFAAGAEIATANTYAVHHDRLQQAGIDERFEELHRTACRMACEARDAHGSGRVAGALGPIGWSYRPDLAPPAAAAATAYAEIAAIQAAHVDLFICETMASVDQARGALLGLQGAGRPVWLAISTMEEDGTRLRSGEPVKDVFAVIDTFKPEAVLVNCTAPEVITDSLRVLRDHGVTLGAYGNGFTRIAEDYKTSTATVSQLQARQDMTPARYADIAEEWVALGATLIGGCCEIGPAHIAELKARFAA